MGYPIGSGAVESANKLVVEARLKGSGMHWARDHVNLMVALRTIVCSDRWEEAWPQISQRIREKAKEHAAARRHKPSPERAAVDKPPPSKVTTGQLPEGTPALTTVGAKNKPAQVGNIPTAGRRPPAADHPWRRMSVGRPPSPQPARLPSAQRGRTPLETCVYLLGPRVLSRGSATTEMCSPAVLSKKHVRSRVIRKPRMVHSRL